MLIREIQLSKRGEWLTTGGGKPECERILRSAIVDDSVEGQQVYAAEKWECGILDLFVMSKSAFATKLIDSPVAFVSGGA
jgi:hypothetical protein